MSKRYKGAILSSTPPTTSTSSASGVWTEQQFMQGVASGSWPALAGAPTIGTATAGALNASVTFTAPTYVGSGITGYTATSSPGGITGTGASSPITVSGLTAGTAYTFTVTATTAAGQSSPSAASNSVTPTAPQYIEDVFSTYLYAGNSSTQTITNGIDLATNGGLVWQAVRSGTNAGAGGPYLFDTVRGALNTLASSDTGASYSRANSLTSFNTTGFTMGSNAFQNGSGNNLVSWTFREQPKFFDIVTYTGNGAASQTINHSLGSVPGCMIVKGISGATNWPVYHRSMDASPQNYYMILDGTTAKTNAVANWGNTAPTSTQFTVGGNNNVNGYTYVVYLFAHDAGGFGAAGTDNVISCGSYTGSGGVDTITLGYEPQWILMQSTSGSVWLMFDTMREMSYTNNVYLNPSTSGAEVSYGTSYIRPTPTGFTVQPGFYGTGATVIYIAIRRGPMKVPTVGTTVFSPNYPPAGQTSPYTATTNFPVDLSLSTIAGSGPYNRQAIDRLRGNPTVNQSAIIQPNLPSAESSSSAGNYQSLQSNTALIDNAFWSGYSLRPIYWLFGRAPSFFDMVCYSGNSVAGTTITHNLGVIPTLMIVKIRTSSRDWIVGTPSIGYNYYLQINQTDPPLLDSTIWNSTAPTASVFTVGDNIRTNGSGSTYVAYLFATCAGVSKVGTYTGNGTTQTIDCGFTSGARFVLIRQSNATADWYVYDTARGMTTLTDPYLLLNSTAAETATLGSVTTVSTGFAVNASILAAINTNAASYIFLAIA